MGSANLFDEAASKRVESIYVTEDAARRRKAVLAALRPKTGEHAIDIGTGPGFLADQLADAVGPLGSVLGVDVSEPMLELARRRCLGKSQVRFEAGDATSLPTGYGTADIAASVQVFEYVPVVEDALDEMYRVLKPGGRGVLVATDWTTLAWNSRDPERMQRILAAFAPHCAHQDLPRRLAPMLRKAGFEVGDLEVLPQFSAEFSESSFGMRLSGPIAAYVAAADPSLAGEAEAWVADLHEAGQCGEYFFCLNQYLFGVTKPS